MTGDAPPVPLVRVRDANLLPDGGPVRVTVSHLNAPEAVAEELASAGARTGIQHGRLTTTTTPSRLVDATGRALGRPTADALDRVLTGALAAWHGPPPDVATPAGVLACSTRPLIMGVLNVTPDSFSDGGRWYDPDEHPRPAVEHGRRLADEGADIIDVGGESTRPGAEPVSEDEELRRVLPVVETLAGAGLTVSIDTSKAAVATAAVRAGAAMVNDVSGGELDAELIPSVVDLRVPYVLMHMQGTPRTMQRAPTYDDVVADVFDHLGAGLRRCATAGLAPSRVIVDPGIGFGKTVEHNLALLADLRELGSLGRPVLVGASRKSFLGKLTGGMPEDRRLEASLAAVAIAVANRAAIVRVHDVAETTRAVAIADAVRRSASIAAPVEV